MFTNQNPRRLLLLRVWFTNITSSARFKLREHGPADDRRNQVSLKKLYFRFERHYGLFIEKAGNRLPHRLLHKQCQAIFCENYAN